MFHRGLKTRKVPEQLWARLGRYSKPRKGCEASDNLESGTASNQAAPPRRGRQQPGPDFTAFWRLGGNTGLVPFQPRVLESRPKPRSSWGLVASLGGRSRQSSTGEWPAGHKGRNCWGRGGHRAGRLGQRGQDTKGQGRSQLSPPEGAPSSSTLPSLQHLTSTSPGTHEEVAPGVLSLPVQAGHRLVDLPCLVGSLLTYLLFKVSQLPLQAQSATRKRDKELFI